MRHLRLLIGTLVTASLLAVSPGFAGPPSDPPGLDRAIEAQEAHNPQLLANPNVVGTAVGLTAGGLPAVTIFTATAGVAGLPASLDGVPVVVQVTGKLYALHHACGHTGGPPGSEPFPCDVPPEVDTNVDPKARFDEPIPIGTSTGNINECSAGTFGALVTKMGNVYALSNNHVYARENAAADDEEIVQPGRFDVNCDSNSGDVIGTLEEFVRLVFPASECTPGTSDPDCNTVDAAIALSPPSPARSLGNETPADGYGIPKSDTFVVTSVPLAVQKYGRTTSLTKGAITGINATVNVGYSSGTARFEEQIIVESKKPFLKSGDSGSLLVVDGGTHDLKPVGLMFAANRSGKFAVANPIELVLSEFGVDIDGEGTP